jgi:hypothetical protein
MNTYSRLVSVIFLCLLSAVSIVRGQSDQVPQEVAGYHVVATYNSEDVACMPANSQRVVLQATQPTVQAFLAEVNGEAVLSTLRQVSSRSLIVEFVSPGSDSARSANGVQRWNEVFHNRPCRSLAPSQEYGNGDEFTYPSPHPGIALVEDLNAGSLTDDNAQSVILQGPSSVGYTADAVALLNNVWTNGNYFLQNGLYFNGGVPFIIWTTMGQGLYPQPYDTSIVSYDGFHTYWFTITYTGNLWWMCVADTSTGGYACAYDTSATGTTLHGDRNTSVWVENFNSDPNWFHSFSTLLRAFSADIYRNGFSQAWTAEHFHTAHACSTSYPVGNAMAGTLTNHGTISFYLSGVPLYC